MKVKHFWPMAVAVAALLLTVVLLVACNPSQTGTGTPKTEGAKELELTILNTNDGRGYVDPCG